jgi:hypothetical protein
MIHISRIFRMIHTGRTFIIASFSWMIPIVRMIPAAGEHCTPAGGEHGDDGQHKQQIFHSGTIPHIESGRYGVFTPPKIS